ncbi:MAG TPA: hypothetical protein VG734_21040 [Lacunisphaera sp.]|nr:hypothetical protein [Lacunisphaera sp.]
MTRCKKLFPLIFLVSLASALSAEAPPAAPSPYGPIEWLAGGLWKATLPPAQDGSTVAIELVATVPANRHGVHLESTWVIGDKRRPYVSGMYAWDAAKKKFAIFYTDSSGALSAGDVAFEEGVLVHEMKVSEPNGNVSPVRVRLTKTGPNAFTNDIYVQKDGTWTQFVSVKYVRQE